MKGEHHGTPAKDTAISPFEVHKFSIVFPRFRFRVAFGHEKNKSRKDKDLWVTLMPWKMACVVNDFLMETRLEDFPFG